MQSQPLLILFGRVGGVKDVRSLGACRIQGVIHVLFQPDLWREQPFLLAHGAHESSWHTGSSALCDIKYSRLLNINTFTTFSTHDFLNLFFSRLLVPKSRDSNRDFRNIKYPRHFLPLKYLRGSLYILWLSKDRTSYHSFIRGWTFMIGNQGMEDDMKGVDFFSRNFEGR